MAATDFIRSLIGWRSSSIHESVAAEEEEPQAESGVAEPNQVASSTLDAPPLSLVEPSTCGVKPITCNAPETPSACDQATSNASLRRAS